MGYMCHHAIVVTSWNESMIRKARRKAGALGMTCSPVGPPTTNMYRSFLIAPDGSKEGWGDSDRGDERRAKMVQWMNAQAYDDGSSALAWVVVQYGDDDMETKVIVDSDELRRQRGDE